MIDNDWQRSMMINDDLWWSMMIIMINDNWLWSTVIVIDQEWLMMIHDNQQWLMMIDNNWLMIDSYKKKWLWTVDRCHVTRDILHVIYDMWHVTHGRRWTICGNFRSLLAHTVWQWKLIEDLEEQDELVTEWMN